MSEVHRGAVSRAEFGRRVGKDFVAHPAPFGGPQPEHSSNMLLHAWHRVDRDVDFDPDTGLARVIKRPGRRTVDDPPRGFASFERSLSGRRHVFAVYRSGDEVFLSAGVNRWRLTEPGLRLVHARATPFVSRFVVSRRSEDAMRFSYVHIGRLFFELVDPTYDRIDHEQAFFLEFLATYALTPTWLEAARTWASQEKP